MNLNKALTIETMNLGSCWPLNVPVNGYETFASNNLVTQVNRGRTFMVIHLPPIEDNSSIESLRIMVRLLEDGYKCWLSLAEILENAFLQKHWSPTLLTSNQILMRIPKVLLWLQSAAKIPNKYLWGGTTGPNFDCSGLVQSAFSSQKIWIPRDAYQQEKFCKNVPIDLNQLAHLQSGDLIFFGTKTICNHVAIYISNGTYIHSSGIENGLNGIGFSSINEKDSVSSYYRSIFRSIGRVCRCHDGTTIL